MTIYSYIDSLLDMWCDWNDIFLTEQLHDDITNLNVMLNSSGSDKPSRAKEMYRIGLLKKELSKGDDAWIALRRGENLQTRLGFISAIVHKALLRDAENGKLRNAYAALCTIYSVIQSERINNTEISIATILIELLNRYPNNSQHSDLVWLRYILSAFYCELEESAKPLEQMFISGKSLPLRILENDKGNIKCRATFVDSADVEKAIDTRVSLTNIIKQKSALFAIGETPSGSCRGFLGQAFLLYKPLLSSIHEIEMKEPGILATIHLESSDSEKPYVFECLEHIAKQYQQFDKEYSIVMKNIVEGAKEALKVLANDGNAHNEHQPVPLQVIYYGCPGTGKSHEVERIIKSAGEVVQVEDTSESRSIKFHEYLKSQPYFSTGDTYHFALRNKGQKGLCTILKNEKWLDVDIKSCFDITDVNIWHEIVNKIKDVHPFHNEYYEDITLHAIDYYIKFLSDKEEVKVNTSFRTTFHPDSDYASFVGCYKPIKVTGENNESKISYEFVPQVFTNAYVCAWDLYNANSQDKVYLVIEEINRGNCAQIFGDLFQLLDRFEDGEKAGFSKYEIEPDADLHQYLVNLFGDNRCAKKLCLPPNFHIIATMNTSDQSLFPMDSAFKRRWSWEYVPIDYNHADSSIFRITLGEKTYEWNEFLSAVNMKIRKVTQSEDKQIGNFFIAHENIIEKEFINKVMFYLWSEVCKDNYQTMDNFFRNGDNENSEFSFTDLFSEDKTILLQGFMKYLGVVSIEDKLKATNPNTQEQTA